MFWLVHTPRVHGPFGLGRWTRVFVQRVLHNRNTVAGSSLRIRFSAKSDAKTHKKGITIGTTPCTTCGMMSTTHSIEFGTRNR